jgi:hypothetical protein
MPSMAVGVGELWGLPPVPKSSFSII